MTTRYRFAWWWGMAVLLSASPASAQIVRHPPYNTVANLGTCTDGEPRIKGVTDGASATDCATGGGSTDVICECKDGTWAAIAGGGGSGDITDVGDCATGACFQSETAGTFFAAPGGGGVAAFRTILDADVPDTITIDLASAATALAANGGNCAAGLWAAGVDASGAAEGCTADDTGTDDQTASEVAVTDAGGFFSGADVEAALQEIGPTMTDSRTPTAHDLAGALHTASGLTAGWTIRATGATTFAWAAIQDGDLPSSIARDAEVPSLETDPGVPLLALADLGDLCAGLQSTRRNAGDTATECFEATALGQTIETGELGFSDFHDIGGTDDDVPDAGEVAVSAIADGTAGQLITWDASGVAATVATGTATHVLTSNGAGAAPTFQAAAGGAPAGSTGEVQINSSGVFGAASGTTWADNGTSKTFTIAGRSTQAAEVLSVSLNGTSSVGLLPGSNAACLSLSRGGGHTPVYLVSGSSGTLTVSTSCSAGASGTFQASALSGVSSINMNGWWQANQGSGGGVAFGSGHQLTWNSTTTATTTGDTGLARTSAGVVKVTNGGAGLGSITYASEVAAPFAQTCTDSGDGSPGALTITVSGATYKAITNSDADGCAATISETGATDGQRLEVVIVSTAGGTVDFADTAGVTEIATAFAAGLWDSITLRYAADRWVEVSRSNN